MKTLSIVLLVAAGAVTRGIGGHSTATRAGQDDTPPIVVLSATGQPLPGVKVFGAYDSTPDKYFDTEFSVSNQRGMATVKEANFWLGLAPDGQIAVSFGQGPIKFGQTGTLRLRLDNGAGVPVRGQALRLFPEKNSSALQQYGLPGVTVLFDGALLGKRFEAKTDASGAVQFSNLPLGVPFGVSTAFTKAKVKGEHTDMMFVGTVQAGESDRVVASRQCSVSGHVHFPNGRPVSGATVVFVYTEYWVGSLDNAPTVIAATKTDRRGFYRISNLPNCQFEVQLSREHYGDVESTATRSKSGKWNPDCEVAILPGRSVCDVLARTHSQSSSLQAPPWY